MFLFTLVTVANLNGGGFVGDIDVKTKTFTTMEECQNFEQQFDDVANAQDIIHQTKFLYVGRCKKVS